MKRTFLIAILILVANFTFAQKTGKVTIDWHFVNIIDGYEHETKLVVSVDGAKVAESTSSMESVKNNILVKIPRGKHKVSLQSMTLYEGKWEERSIANGYSGEGLVELDIEIKKKNTISLLFDINETEPTVTIK